MLPVLLLAFLAAGPAAAREEAGEGLRPEGHLRVELKAPGMVMISAPVAGRIVELAVQDGQSFHKDQLLLRFDDTLARLRLEAAEAARDQAGSQLRLAEKLYQLNSRGAQDVEMARAQFKGAEAERGLAEELVNRCRVTAPWNGRVTQLEVKEHQYLPEGAPLLELAADGPMEIEFMMPSAWIPSFQPGAAFEVMVEETGQKYPATVTRLGGKVDALTQSIKVYGRLSGGTAGLLPGMSGTVISPEP